MSESASPNSPGRREPSPAEAPRVRNHDGDRIARGEPIAVTGIGVISPIGCNVPEFVDGLRQGRNGVSRIERFDTSGFRTAYGGEIKQELQAELEPDQRRHPVDRASILALAACRETLHLGRIDPEGLRDRRIGVCLGSCSGGYLGGLRYYTRKIVHGRGAPSYLLDLPLHAAASRMATKYGLRGPISIVSNACASGAIAVTHAVSLLRRGRVEAMLTGGFEALSPLNLGGFGALRNCSTGDRVRPFDRNRDGLLLGEAAAVFMLEPLEAAKRRGAVIWGLLLGSGVTSDTYHFTAPDPSGSGAAGAMNLAIESAGLTTRDIDYVNAHGTATPHNDRMETHAIKRVFADAAASIPVSSTKSMIGHTLGAAGAIELAATLLALREGFVPPTINYETADPHCDLDYVPNRSRPARLRAALSNSFGFGGTNCCLVVGREDISSRT